MATIYDTSLCTEELNQKYQHEHKITKCEDVDFLYDNETYTQQAITEPPMTSWEDIVALLYDNEADTQQFHLSEENTSWDDVVTLLYKNEAKTNHTPLAQTMTLLEDEVNTQAACLS
jgi:hypothetical protein